MYTKSALKGLRERILNDRYNAIVFHAGRGRPLCLVGGYIRDLIIGRDSPDRDYMVGGDIDSLLEQIIRKTGGKLVMLGNYLSRIVLTDNSTLDFSPLAADIESDLARRDFTMNSLAWSPDSGLIDPHGGVEHIRQRRISAISRDSMAHDPVRLLRAHRFAAELSFCIDRATRRIVRELSDRIKESKSERITLEFFKILNLKAPFKTLAMMEKDGLLKQVFYCDNKVLQHKLRVLSRVSRTVNELPLKYRSMLRSIYSQNLSWWGMLCLEALMSGLPASTLSISSKIRRRLEDIEKGKKLLQSPKPSRAELFDAFDLMGDATIDFLIVNGRTIFLKHYQIYRRIMKKSLLTTEEIIAKGGLAEGVNLGRAILGLKRAQFCHSIRTQSEAIHLLRDYSLHRI